MPEKPLPGTLKLAVEREETQQTAHPFCNSSLFKSSAVGYYSAVRQKVFQTIAAVDDGLTWNLFF